MSVDASIALPDGLVAIVKRECATCVMVVPVLQRLIIEHGLTVYTPDDPTFPDGIDAIHDADLSVSWHHEIETVPTLMRVVEGAEIVRRAAGGQPRPSDEAARLDRILRLLTGFRCHPGASCACIDHGGGRVRVGGCARLARCFARRGGPSRLGVVRLRACRKSEDEERLHEPPIFETSPHKYASWALRMPTIDTTCSACACER